MRSPDVTSGQPARCAAGMRRSTKKSWSFLPAGRPQGPKTVPRFRPPHLERALERAGVEEGLAADVGHENRSACSARTLNPPQSTSPGRGSSTAGSGGAGAGGRPRPRRGRPGSLQPYAVVLFDSPDPPPSARSQSRARRAGTPQREPPRARPPASRAPRATEQRPPPRAALATNTSSSVTPIARCYSALFASLSSQPIAPLGKPPLTHASPPPRLEPPCSSTSHRRTAPELSAQALRVLEVTRRPPAPGTHGGTPRPAPRPPALHLGRHLRPAGRVHRARQCLFPSGKYGLPEGGAGITGVRIAAVVGEVQSLLPAVARRLFTAAPEQRAHPRRIARLHGRERRQSSVAAQPVEHGLHLVIGRVRQNDAVAAPLSGHGQGRLPASVSRSLLDVALGFHDRPVDHREAYAQPAAGRHHDGLVVVALGAPQMVVDVKHVERGRPVPPPPRRWPAGAGAPASPDHRRP